MKELLAYILKEVKDKRLTKEMAVHLIKQVQPVQPEGGNPDFLHPLLHRNTSDLTAQRFSSTFTGNEFFLAQHTIQGQKILPGTAHLEMVRCAVVLSSENKNRDVVMLKDISWIQPLIVEGNPIVIHTSLFQLENGQIYFEIYSGNEQETTVYSQGHVVLTPRKLETVLDLVALRAECSAATLNTEECYAAFEMLGMEYGPFFRGIKKVYAGNKKVLAKIALPTLAEATLSEFYLHPSLLDAALQAMIGLQTSEGKIVSDLKPKIPFTLAQAEVYGPCTQNMWVLITEEEDSNDVIQRLTITLCDNNGQPSMRFKGFAFRILSEAIRELTDPAISGTLLFEPFEEAKEVTTLTDPEYSRHIVILCGPEKEWQERIERGLMHVNLSILFAEGKDINTFFEQYAAGVFEHVKEILTTNIKGKILLQVVVADLTATKLFGGLSALIKTASMENPNLSGQLIEVRSSIDHIAEILLENSRSPLDSHIVYNGGVRSVINWKKLEKTGEKLPWKDSGTYLLTGGTGSLGLIFAREIALQTKHATLILTGRTELNESKKIQLKELEELGATVAYVQLNVVDLQAVEKCMDDIRQEFGWLDGIIHSAGIIHDQYIIHKSKEEFLQVLGPKVAGTVNLDIASRDLELDFFILFSSGSGVTGNPGQADYATANAFMDSYAHYRNKLAANKQRYGQTLSVNWPLWNEGGMQMHEATLNLLKQSIGLEGMDTDRGIQVLYESFGSGYGQVIVMNGEVRRLEALVSGGGQQIRMPSGNKEKIYAEKDTDLFPGQIIHEEKALEFFKNQIALFIKLSPHRIKVEMPLETYGVESILMVQLTSHLEKIFGPLPKTLFFEYQSVQAITSYFLQNYEDKLVQLLHQSGHVTVNKEVVLPVNQIPITHKSAVPRLAVKNIRTDPQADPEQTDIAIIGISGKYPQAENIRQFWQNLMDGKDCITEIPKDRWNHDLYFSTDKGTPGKTPCKWGGFLDEIDRFDPLFFNMSPREAAITDPQERLFLETVWNLFESSGYTKQSLQHDYSGKVGIYVGAMYQQYQLLNSAIPQESLTSLSTHSAIANRVSYFFNFQGPSIAIDTACSSSIVALHSACESLRRGECRLAVAGGVNLTLHPKKYLGLSLVNLIGSHTESRSFGNGDGYLPSEGVGALLLKPLSEAIKDGDNILAVIKSTAINHNGHGNGFTAPNPLAQAQLIEENFKKANIDPRSVSYVEAAANGSLLGDPIELAGLSKVFKKFTTDEHFCAVGSVKSNIGHAESASGISQLTKVILQLKHQKLVPSIKAFPLNPNINFEHSPFYIQQELTDWEITTDLTGQPQPRRATVSSFGAGGTNGHVILEEYVPALKTISPAISEDPCVLVFSARSEERLQVIVQQIVHYLTLNNEEELISLAYTLQTGREAMSCRLALVVRSREELILVLREYLNRDQSGRNNYPVPVYTWNSEKDHDEITGILFGKSGKVLLDLAFSENNMEQLALYWTKGVDVPWMKLYLNKDVQRILIPTYPFDKQRCWVELKPADKYFNPEPESPLLKGDSEDFENDVYRLIINLFGLREEDFNPERPLLQYGLDSIIFVQLIQQLQMRINPMIKLAIIQNCRTSKEILETVLKLKKELPVPGKTGYQFSIAKSWPQFPELILLNENSGGLPVFWIHAGAGGVEPYQQLAQQSNRPFYGIQARGYMTSRAPLQGIHAMAAYYIQIIQSVQPEGPYDLGGYSLGGVIAYEMCRQLQEMNQTVNSIVMLDSLYGKEFKDEVFNEKDAILQTVNIALSASIAQDPEKIAQTLINRQHINSDMDDHEFMMQLIHLAGERGLTGNDTKLQAFISQTIKVQRAYRSSDYVVIPLPDPEGVTCYYFRNKSGLFLGEMAPYFLVNRDKTAFDHANYWAEWEKQFPDFHMMDMDVDNHMMILSDPASFETISAFCSRLYSEVKLSAKVLKDFKIKTKKKHNRKNSLRSAGIPG